MRFGWIVIAAVLAAGVAAMLFVHSANKEKNELAKTRAELRQQGFKTDLADFDFSAPAELADRAQAITNGWVKGYQPRGFNYHLEPMSKVGRDSAAVVWKENNLTTDYPRQELWPSLRTLFDGDAAELDASRNAVMSGPFRFSLRSSGGATMLLPHLAAIKKVAENFSAMTMLELHDGNRDAAWTNLLATTRVLTGWQVESVEVSQLVRYEIATVAFGTTWESLQTNGWTDAQLARLQHEWETVDFIKQLPEIAAFDGVSMAALCASDRAQPLRSAPNPALVFHEPRIAWMEFSSYWQQMNYRHHGSYEDERGMLLFYRDRETELRSAVQSPSWSEMRSLPAATNRLVYQSKSRTGSRWRPAMNARQIAMSMRMRGGGILAQAAQAETRRRLVITAIALERYHGRHGSYPAALQNLAPEFLASVPLDFMDGKLLRYRLAPEGGFVLYSVGLDCTDDGGQLASSERPGFGGGFLNRPGGFGGMGSMGDGGGTDLVWPRAASEADVTAQQAEKKHQADMQIAAFRESQRVEEENIEAKRKETVARLLAQAEEAKTNAAVYARHSPEPTFGGKPLSQIIQNQRTAGTNQLSLLDLLTLKQVITGDEPFKVTFEAQVDYGAVKKVGRLLLGIDGGNDDESFVDDGGNQTCKRATNGDCLLSWETTEDAPGMHTIQAEFASVPTRLSQSDDLVTEKGPVLPYFSTNIFQFEPQYNVFNDAGATLYARLVESNGNYTIRIKTSGGDLLRTLTGSTTNGIINVHWDLKDNHGRRCTNDSFETTWDVTLPGSGRRQNMN